MAVDPKEAKDAKAAVQPDTDTARALTQHFVRALDEYTAKHPEVGFADVLVAVRAFYRTTCVWLATHLRLRAENRLGFFRQELEHLGANLTADHDRMTKELDARGN
jgi:predicted component of type VI protein secretion system